MQIKTGEGKSVILGVLSLVLSLLGNKVNCVCYSEYLKTRDYNDFKELFEAFDVTDLVSYGTFSEISENLINEKGNMRDIVANLFDHEDNSKK